MFNAFMAGYMKKSYMAMVAWLLFLGSIHAMAFEEFDSPEGKIVQIKSQEYLVLLMSELNLSDNDSIFIVVPTSSALAHDSTSKGTTSFMGGDYALDNKDHINISDSNTPLASATCRCNRNGTKDARSSKPCCCCGDVDKTCVAGCHDKTCIGVTKTGCCVDASTTC